MKFLKLGAAVIILGVYSCTNATKNEKSTTGVSTLSKSTSLKKSAYITDQNQGDKEEIQDLVRNMLNWAENKKTFNLVPLLTDSNDSICVGFNLQALRTNVQILKSSNFFSAEFIENYNQIILTLDSKMKNKKIEKWSTGELPPFNFANDVDPWCDCQDVPYDTPVAWGLVDIYVVNLNKQNGELYWKWGKLGAGISKDWKDFSYKFNVKKEGGKWKIAYLEGFDFNESIKS